MVGSVDPVAGVGVRGVVSSSERARDRRRCVERSLIVREASERAKSGFIELALEE